MSANDERDQAIAHLKATLGQSELSPALSDRGQALLQRLTSAVRMTFLGLPGSGKTELINLLLGSNVLPAGTNCPTAELIWGSNAACKIVKGDGTEERLAWPVASNYDWSDAVFVKIAHPHPVLKKISFLEIVTDGSPEDLSSALNWAIPRTDISIWCTQELGRLEHALWVQVPDAMKDHGYLVVTRADQLSATGALPSLLKKLSPIVDQEFQSLHAVATKTFLDALDETGAVPGDIRKSSGAGGLIDQLMGHVNSGRQADLDGAVVFLSRHGVAEIPEVVDAEPEDEVSDIEIATETPPTSENSDPSVVNEAAAFARASGIELSQITQNSSDVAEDVLNHCVSAMDHLVEMVSQSAGEPEDLVEEIEQAHELLVLMQLEQGEASAADAATVLLQVTHELELAKAA